MSSIQGKPFLSRLNQHFTLIIAVFFLLFVGMQTANASGIYGSAGEWINGNHQLAMSGTDLAADGDILHQISSLSSSGIGEDATTPPSDGGGALTVGRDSLATTLGILVAVLFAVVLLLVFISANLVNLIRVREGQQAYTFGGTLKLTKELALNPYIATFGNLVMVVVVLFIATPIARGVGLHQGYQPDQPIYFSHKIHAGKFEIDCQYCHTGAGQGKNAWIPSVNVCWNCHNAVQNVGPGYSETMTEFYNKQIAKVREHYQTNTPIEWVRIHNLPDLSYFNHQQHVVAGKQECQTCHGPVEEMDVVYQFSPLSMGWCVNCHRETEVNADYYKNVAGWDHAKYVEDIGGLSCARCHY